MVAGAPFDATKVRVLVVDDDAALRRMVTMVLEDAEWDFQEAKDGPEALAAMRSSPGHLVVLLDWRMPDMSGEEVLDIVVASPELAMRHAYVLITANATAVTPHLTDLLHRLGAPMVAKPFNINELLRTVEHQARRISAQEAAS
jgi:CheY-like chemotaxis protein